MLAAADQHDVLAELEMNIDVMMCLVVDDEGMIVVVVELREYSSSRMLKRSINFKSEKFVNFSEQKSPFYGTKNESMIFKAFSMMIHIILINRVNSEIKFS